MKVLRSEDFAGSPVQSRLLKYIVDYSLNGEAKSGKEIAIDIFTESDPDSTNVKANTSFVRAKLVLYYANEGAQDIVKIDLPKGRTYQASFSYRFDAEAYRLYEQGLNLIGNDGRPSMYRARRYLDLAIARDSSLSIARVEKLRLEICYGLLDHALTAGDFDPAYYFHEVLEGEFEAVEANGDYWLVWCLHGIARFLGNDKDLAAYAFARALALDAEKVRESVWYSFYLLLNGSKNEAIQLSQAWDGPFKDEWMIVVRALFFYIAGDPSETIKLLYSMRERSKEQHILAFLLHGLAFFMARLQESALKFVFIATDPRIDSETEVGKCLRERAALFGSLKTFPTLWGGGLPDLFAGFNVLMLADQKFRYGTDTLVEANQLLRELIGSSNVRRFQLAIAFLALGRKRNAVACLRSAIRRGDIFALQMDNLPFFAELKGYKYFEALKADVGRGTVPEVSRIID